MQFSAWALMEEWRIEVAQRLARAGRRRELERWANCGHQRVATTCEAGHNREHVAGWRCELRCCPRCSAKHALRVASRIDRVIPDMEEWCDAAMLTFTKRPEAWPHPSVSAREDALAVSAALAATQAAVRAAGSVATLGTVEWGEHGGLAHAHVLVALPRAGKLGREEAHSIGLDAWRTQITEHDSAQTSVEKASFSGTRWYMLEYALKTSHCTPIACVERMLALKGLRRYRTTGAFQGLGDDPSDHLWIDDETGEIANERVTCPRCDGVRAVADAVIHERGPVIPADDDADLRRARGLDRAMRRSYCALHDDDPETSANLGR